MSKAREMIDASEDLLPVDEKIQSDLDLAATLTRLLVGDTKMALNELNGSPMTKIGIYKGSTTPEEYNANFERIFNKFRNILKDVRSM